MVYFIPISDDTPVLFSTQADDDLSGVSAHLRRDPTSCAISVITALHGQSEIHTWEYLSWGRRRAITNDLVFEYDTHPHAILVVRVQALATTPYGQNRKVGSQRGRKSKKLAPSG